MLSTPALTRLLLRAFLVPALVLLGVTGYLVTSAALAASSTVHHLDSARPPASSAWKADYSRRFPGCVASVLWPERETPVAVVVRWPSGEVDRIAGTKATPQEFVPVRQGHAEIIGACYRS